MKFLGAIFKAVLSAMLALFGVACLLVAYDQYVRNKYPVKYISFDDGE